MYKYKYLDNGWTIQIDEDIKTLSDDDLKEMTRMVVNNMVVIFRNQTLTPDDELRICNVIGEYQHYPAGAERIKHIRLNEGILRVTGQKNQYGEEGLFGHRAALDWHANQPSNNDRKPLIWLYGESGTKGSRTSWINNIASYEDLSDKMKETIEDIKIYCGYQRGKYSNSSFFIDHVNDKNPLNLVQVNKEGKKGLYFPFLQIFGFEGYSEEKFNQIMDELTKHVLQEKYVYHHDWEDGDIVISEQWLSVHKRWEFDHMDTRVLHRIAFDYSKVYT